MIVNMKKRELTIEERQKIVTLHKMGLGYKKIYQKTNCKLCTIQKIIQKWKKSGTVANKLRKGGPRKTSSRIDREIIKKITAKRSLSAPKIAGQLHEQFGVSIHPQTVRNRIHDAGFKARVARKKPFISKKNEAARLKWAKEHSTWTIDDWKRVIWSDESKFNLFGSDGIVKVWRKPGEDMRKDCLRKTVKHGGGSVMVWGSMAWNGVGTMQFIDEIMTKEVYQRILETNLFASARKLRIRNRFIFQQDSDPKHTAKIIQEWFKNKRVSLLPWAAQSPDLNPIEHLWSELERKITNRNPSSKEELKKNNFSRMGKFGFIYYKKPR